MKTFDLNDFKKWIKTKEEDDLSLKQVDFLEGDDVTSKISMKNFYYRIKTKEENLRKKITKDFFEFGGKICKIEENIITIQTNNKYKFKINKIYLKLD